MTEKLAIFGKAQGYVLTALIISLGATTLLIFKHIDQTTWAGVVQWTWASVCGGGMVSAYRK